MYPVSEPYWQDYINSTIMYGVQKNKLNLPVISLFFRYKVASDHPVHKNAVFLDTLYKFCKVGSVSEI